MRCWSRYVGAVVSLHGCFFSASLYCSHLEAPGDLHECIVTVIVKILKLWWNWIICWEVEGERVDETTKTPKELSQLRLSDLDLEWLLNTACSSCVTKFAFCWRGAAQLSVRKHCGLSHPLYKRSLNSWTDSTGKPMSWHLLFLMWSVKIDVSAVIIQNRWYWSPNKNREEKWMRE